MVCPGASVPALRRVVARPVYRGQGPSGAGATAAQGGYLGALPVVLSNPYLHWDSHCCAPGRTLGLGCTARVPTGP